MAYQRGKHEKRKPVKQRMGGLILLYTLPLAAGMGYAIFRWGETVKKLIHVLIKLAVKA